VPRGDGGSIFVERRGVDIVEYIGICTLNRENQRNDREIHTTRSL
jgi:hypothetical protein